MTLLGDYLWPQLVSLTASLRTRTDVPILVVGDVTPPGDLFDEDGRSIGTSDLFFVKGPPQNVIFLEKCGHARKSTTRRASRKAPLTSDIRAGVACRTRRVL